MGALAALLGLNALLPASVSTQAKYRRYPGTSIEELRRLAENEDLDAVYRLGERRDTASIPLLLKYSKPLFVSRPPQKESLAARKESASRRKQVALSLEARRAIARMGTHPDISDYTSCLTDAAAYDKGACIDALGYIGDIKAVKHLAPLLWDEGAPPHSSHELVFSYAEATAQALGKILPDVQTRFMLQSPNTASRVGQWRDWWNQREEFGEAYYNHNALPTRRGGFRKLFRN